MSAVSVIHSQDREVYEFVPGNRLRGLATKSVGSSEVALWNHVLDAGVDTPLHWHDHDQVIYVVAGSGTVTVAEQEVSISTGDTVVAPARIHHRVRAAADEPLDTLVAMPADLRSFRPDGSEIDTPWHT